MSTAANSHWNAKRNQKSRNARTHFVLSVCLCVVIEIAQSQLNIGLDFNITLGSVGFGLSSWNASASEFMPCWGKRGQTNTGQSAQDWTYVFLTPAHSLPLGHTNHRPHWCMSISVAGVFFTLVWSIYKATTTKCRHKRPFAQQCRSEMMVIAMNVM